MQIYICDDDEKDLQQLASFVHQYDSGKQMEIRCFSSALALYRAAQERPCDIAFLDIEMEPPNGYEIAQQLLLSKMPPLMIFVTKSMDYTICGYGVAFRYLPKPISFPQVFAAMDAAVREVTANRFQFTADGISVVLRMPEIYYIEVLGHFSTLHTIDQEFTTRATLKEILSQLPQGYFGAPHQSYIVNYMHIRTATAQKIRLTNGACIPISRRKQKEFEHQFHVFLGR